VENGDAGAGGLLDEEGAGALAVGPTMEAEGVGTERLGEFVGVEGEGEQTEEAGEVGTQKSAVVCEEEEGAPLRLGGGERDERAGKMRRRAGDSGAVVLQPDGWGDEGAGQQWPEPGALDEGGDDGRDGEVVGGVSAGWREEPVIIARSAIFSSECSSFDLKCAGFQFSRLS